MSEEENSISEPVAAPEVAEEIVVERLYNIPLGRVYDTVRKRRAKRAITMVRDFILRHMKLEDEADLVLDPALNEYIWSRGIEKPPRRVRVRATKDKDGFVKVYLVEG